MDDTICWETHLFPGIMSNVAFRPCNLNVIKELNVNFAVDLISTRRFNKGNCVLKKQVLVILSGISKTIMITLTHRVHFICDGDGKLFWISSLDRFDHLILFLTVGQEQLLLYTGIFEPVE